MSLAVEEEPQTQREPALASLTEEVRRQGRSIRSTQQAFTIFAVLALLIALANLVAVAAKLEKSTPAVKVSATAAPAAKATPAAALPSRVAVGLKEFTVTPSAHVAKAGKVTFAVRNGGKVTHEFVVLQTNKPAGALMKGARADETGNVGETGDLAPGAAKTFSIKLKPGHYALICNLPGHYAAGQHTDFTVR